MEQTTVESGSDPRSAASKPAIDEPSSPYFLHHSDSPGLVLVTQQLTGENYSSWSRAMIIALSVKNKLAFVDGSMKKPETKEADLVNSWIRNNNMVISWILNSVSKDISASVIYASSAYEIWNDLKERFQQSNGPQIFQLKKELINLMQDENTVSVFFTKLKTIWEELSNFRPNCSCGKCVCGGVQELNKHYQMEYIMTFLMGLHDSFSQVRGQVLLMDPIPSINKVFSLISQEENQRKICTSSIGANSDGGSAFAFRSDNGRGGRGNFNSNFRNASGNRNKDRPYCSHCKYHGHSIDKCYKIHGFLPGFKSRLRDNFQHFPKTNTVNQVSVNSQIEEKPMDQQTGVYKFMQNLNSDQYQHLMTMLSTHLASTSQPVPADLDKAESSYAAGIYHSKSVNPTFVSKDIWIVDSGASRHVCSIAAAFISLRPVTNSSVTLPNHTRIPVSLCGDVKLVSVLAWRLFICTNNLFFI